MPWNDQSGDGRGQGPWGQNPQRPRQPRRNDDYRPPDLEELMRRWRQRVRGPGGGGGGPGGGMRQMGPQGFMVLGAFLVVGWLASGVYIVDAGEMGVVTRFGAFNRLTTPGLHVHLPAPFEDVRVERVSEQRSQEVGFRGSEERQNESWMLTRDEAIVDIDFTVIWQLSDRPQDFVFNVKDPQELVLAVAESAMRETVGQNDLEKIISTERSNVEARTRDGMQRMLDSYRAGIRVLRVQLQKATAPEPMIEAFNEVDRARAEAEANVNQAAGQGARMTQEAEAYRERVVREASGEAERFNLIYDQYRRSPRVTRERLYLETMEEVYGGADKIIIDQRSGAQPYLPLDQLRNRTRSGQ
jgi:membrane protease subunit HflK